MQEEISRSFARFVYTFVQFFIVGMFVSFNRAFFRNFHHLHFYASLARYMTVWILGNILGILMMISVLYVSGGRLPW